MFAEEVETDSKMSQNLKASWLAALKISGISVIIPVSFIM